jgi:hypothetical protein
LAHLVLDELQFLESQLQKPSVDRIELLACAECVAQLFLRSTQAIVGQGRQSRRVGFSVGQRRRGLKQYDKYSSGADLKYLFED